MKLKALLMAGTVAIAGAAGIAGSDAHAQNSSYLLSTAGTGGTYYPVGVAIATLTSVRIQPRHGMAMSAINSAGSGENIKLLREDQVDFAIVQGLWGAYAASGTGPLAEDGVQSNLRSITALWPNVEHFAIRSDLVETGTIADLLAQEGIGFAIGARNSGTEGSNRHILAGLGIEDPEAHFSVEFMGYTPSAEAFQNNQLDAINPAAGPPVGAYTRLTAAVGDEITLLGFTDEQIEAANGPFDSLWVPFLIEAGTYSGQDEDVTTIGQPNFLAVDDDVPTEDVYLLTKTMFENLPFLNAIHPATEFMALDSALNGLPVPLHPGAVQYYQEVGIDIPERLMPPM